jgi:anti-sigma regulatory factor (Ser/Thr protein kinase)
MFVTTPAAPKHLAVSRGRLRDWLAGAGVDSESSADVLLAVGEATANATEHSVLGTDRDVHLTVNAALNGKLLQLSVRDDGQWKPKAVSDGHRGHGLHLIHALVDSVELTTSPDGTTVAMRKELP